MAARKDAVKRDLAWAGSVLREHYRRREEELAWAGSVLRERYWRGRVPPALVEASVEELPRAADRARGR